MKNINKVLIGLGVVWLLILTIAVFHPDAVKKLGSQIQSEPFWFTNGIQLGLQGELNNSVSLKMLNGQNQVSWLNNTGAPVTFRGTDVYATLVNAGSSTVTVASTSMLLYAATSTTSTTTDKLTPLTGLLFDKVLIATSTPQGTSVGVYATSAFTGSNEEAALTIPNGTYLIFVMEPPVFPNCGGGCEQATSTNRGFNLLINAPYSSP